MGKKSRQKKEKRESGEITIKEKKFIQTGWEKALIFIIQWGTYLLLFTPLIINTNFFFPFVAPKTVFFRIIVEIMLAAYLLLIYIDRRYRPKINPLVIALSLFLAVLIIASFTGINFSRSFWSTYERMTGIFTMLHLFAFFIITTNVFKKREDWINFLGVSVIVGIILSLYILTGNAMSTRGGGTIGNTSFMAAYLMFDIFFAIILFFSKRKWWQIFAGISLLFMLPVFFTSTARGAIGSFLMALFLMLLGYMIFSGKKIIKRTAIAIIILLLIAITSLAIIQPPIVKDFAKNLRFEMNSRFAVWETGWKGFLERPILGWGPENFNVVFLKYFNPCMSLQECGSEVWFDRTHNIILDTLVTTGIFGLVSYLVIFIITIYGLIKIIPQINEKKNIFIPLGLIALLVAYFIQNMLVFDMINSYLVLFLTLGFVSFLMNQGKEEETIKIPKRPVNMVVFCAVTGLTIFLIWSANINTLAANNYIIRTVNSENVYESIDYFNKSVDTWMEKYEAREQFAQKLIRSSYQLTDISPEEKNIFNDIFLIGEREMENSIKENPLDFRHHLFAGEVYTGSFRISNNPAKTQRAEEILMKAIELSPTNQQGYWQLAEVNVAQGKLDKALPYLEKAVDVEPKVGRSHWYLAMGYRLAGKNQLALQEIESAYDNGYNWIDNTQDLNKVISILNSLNINPTDFLAKKGQKTINSLTVLLQNDPENLNAWMYLAASYANTGQYEKAKETAQKVIELDPSMDYQVNEFLESLPSNEILE